MERSARSTKGKMAASNETASEFIPAGVGLDIFYKMSPHVKQMRQNAMKPKNTIKRNAIYPISGTPGTPQIYRHLVVKGLAKVQRPVRKQQDPRGGSLATARPSTSHVSSGGGFHQSGAQTSRLHFDEKGEKDEKVNIERAKEMAVAAMKGKQKPQVRPATTARTLRLPGAAQTLDGKPVRWHRLSAFGPEMPELRAPVTPHTTEKIEPQMTTQKKRNMARDNLATAFEGGESVNRKQRGGHDYREYNGYYELQRRIRQSEQRKSHAFAGSSVFHHLHPRKNGINDVATDWLEADLQVAETKLEEEENKSKAQVKRFKKSKMRAPLGEGHDDPMRQLMKEYQGDADDAKEEDAAILDPTRVRNVRTPDYAYRVLNAKCTWNAKQALRNDDRMQRLSQQLELQSAILTKQKAEAMGQWLGHYERAHDALMTGMEADLDQQDRDRYTRLLAKLGAINEDIDQCMNADDPHHGHLDLTLRAMRLNADKSISEEKLAVHTTHPWYFQLTSILNTSKEPLFCRAEETFIEALKVAAEEAGKLTPALLLEVVGESQGLDTERDGTRLVLDCCLINMGLTPGTDEFGLWNERISKRMPEYRKPVQARRVGGTAAADTEQGKAVMSSEMETSEKKSFYLTTLPYVNE